MKPAPVTDKNRSLAPDLARGFMLLLIAMAYAPTYLFNVEVGLYTHPAGGGLPDKFVHVMSLLFLDSRAYPMFSVLFGFGMAALVVRQRSAGLPDPEIRRLVRRRGLFLLLFGFVHGVLVYGGEILGPYGIATLLLGWLLFRQDRALKKAVLIMAPILVLTAWVLGIFMVTNDVMAPVPDYSIAGLIERIFSYPFAILFSLVLFPILLIIVIGMWAGRRGILFKPESHVSLLKKVAFIGIPISVAGALPITLTEIGWWAPGVEISGLMFGVQVLTGMFGGIGYAAVFGLISIRIQRNPGVVARMLAAAGKRSLTCYVLQSTLIAVVLSEPLFGLGGKIHSAGAALVAIGAWGVSVLFATYLEKRNQRGPLDVLLRRLVYRSGSVKGQAGG
ncbi:DUF418 domain-containing protein [Paenibacillus sp. JCM 10914]|uniref:DUF418 domain-containing protein n=1 Tax=Paenibacillus sp. JCM 10914 TaxID=1236974 RepID=UPI0003CC7DCE|nr:DUF418 domain-containing protein [Paenibacillus sp. JCM 10914]GAE06975.1 hypothetical protein JCM10914_3172 [Paenibacillus sp. JCM 10914]